MVNIYFRVVSIFNIIFRICKSFLSFVGKYLNFYPKDACSLSVAFFIVLIEVEVILQKWEMKLSTLPHTKQKTKEMQK